MSDKIREAFEEWYRNNCPYAGATARLAAFSAWQAALAQQPAPAAVPDGWKLVPVKPTTDMCKAAAEATGESDDYHEMLGRAYVGYSAMLAAAPAAPVARFLPDLPEQMARDLARFNETCEDGQEYDVPKERMRAMANFGLVRWCGGSRFEITDCGIAALEAMAAPPAAEQPDTVKVSKELLERVLSGEECSAAADELRDLLAGGDKP